MRIYLGRLSEESGWKNGHDSIVVSTSRCGRENPGSNPGHGRVNALNGKPAYFLCYDKQY